MCGKELFLCSLQSRLILCQALALQIKLLGKQRLLGCKPRNAGIHVLDACRSELEFALSKSDLLAKSGDGRSAVLDGLARRVPIRLRQPQRLVALVDLRLRGLDGGVGFIEVRGGRAHRVRRVLRALLERCVLPGELPDLLHRSSIFRLERIQIGLGSDGRRVAVAQRVGKRAHLLGGCGYLLLERLLRGSGAFQPLGVVRLAAEAFL